MFRYLAITDQTRCPVPVTDRIRTLAELGVPAIQIRDKTRSDRERYEIACDSIGYGDETTILINGRADLARLVGADGVHRPGNGLPVQRLRNLLSPGDLVGCSVHSLNEARRAEVNGAEYVCYGPVAPTPSKPKLSQTECVGVDGVRQLCNTAQIPVIALGGVTPELARTCRDAGAFGAAGIGWLMDTDHPERRWKAMKEAVS